MCEKEHKTTVEESDDNLMFGIPEKLFVANRDEVIKWENKCRTQRIVFSRNCKHIIKQHNEIKLETIKRIEIHLTSKMVKNVPFQIPLTTMN